MEIIWSVKCIKAFGKIFLFATGLHKLREAGKRKWRENEKMERKWRTNEKMERKW